MEGMEKALVARRQDHYEVYIYSWKLARDITMQCVSSELLATVLRQLGIKAEVSAESWGDNQAHTVVDAINAEKLPQKEGA